MPLKRTILKALILSTAALTTACGTTSTSLRVSQIPLRADLSRCPALLPVQSETLPPVAAAPAERAVQLEERAFWMQRDLQQTANNRDACNRQGELVALIQANNAGPQ